MNRYVVGLSTIPPRFSNLSNVLDSLINQKIQPHKIYLYISDFYPRFNISITNSMIPSYLNKYIPILKIVRGRDYGPISKLFCSLKNEFDPHTTIITCDDDLIYGKNWLNELIVNSNRLIDCAVGFRGRLLSKENLRYSNSKYITCSGIKQDSEIDIITAVRGWAYKRKFFDLDFISNWEKSEKQHPFIFFNDDIWISGQLEKLNIKKIVVPSILAKSENMKLHSTSLIKSKGQHEKTNMHIQLFKKYWKPKLN